MGVEPGNKRKANAVTEARGSSGFQSLGPLELPERNSCRCVGEGGEGRGLTHHWEPGSHRE